MLRCVIEGRDNFSNYFELFSYQKWYYIVELLTPWSKFVVLKSMVGPVKFNTMLGKVLRELRSLVKRNIEQVVRNVETAEAEDNSVLLTYLNRGINFPPFDNNELSIYMNGIAIVPQTSIENYAASHFSYWIHYREIYPVLCLLALSLMYPKSSSVDVERLFSQTRYVPERRGKMKANTFNTFMRLKNLFHFFGLCADDLNTIYDDRYFNSSIEDDDQSFLDDSDSDIDD